MQCSIRLAEIEGGDIAPELIQGELESGLEVGASQKLDRPVPNGLLGVFRKSHFHG